MTACPAGLERSQTTMFIRHFTTLQTRPEQVNCAWLKRLRTMIGRSSKFTCNHKILRIVRWGRIKLFCGRNESHRERNFAKPNLTCACYRLTFLCDRVYAGGQCTCKWLENGVADFRAAPEACKSQRSTPYEEKNNYRVLCEARCHVNTLNDRTVNTVSADARKLIWVYKTCINWSCMLGLGLTANG